MTYVFPGLSRSTGVAFLLLVAFLCRCSAAHAQIAPGPLSKAHAGLKGLLNCTSCHGLLRRGLKCLGCHDEINRRVKANLGYHARAYKSSGGNCAQCHEEHRGPEFVFVPLDRENFNHGDQTGFTLAGKHREQKCESCHNETNMDVAMRSEIKLKDLNRSFLGLHRECTSCHNDPHQQQLGDDCLKCHTVKVWSPASGFNHSSTALPLTGRHRQVPCERCHPGIAVDRTSGVQVRKPLLKDSSDKRLLFKGLSFSDCGSCHTDPHHGAFKELNLKGGCEACHTTAGWKNNRPGEDFNHTLTKFRLIGKHSDLSCNTCHKNSNFRIPIAHDLCGDCHEDPHKGEYYSQPDGLDCSACHSPMSFKPSLFNTESHMKSAFPLEGKHATLPCSECHRHEGRQSPQAFDKLLCSECHADPHAGEFASDPYDNKCDLCHTAEGFETTTFTPQRHMQTRFPLAGIHAQLACDKCHEPFPGNSDNSSKIPGTFLEISAPDAANSSIAAGAKQRYHFVSSDCDTCHSDPHGIRPQAGLPCRTCHIPQQPDVPLQFDHSRAGITLEGSHRYLTQITACIKCHAPSGQAGEVPKGIAPVFSEVNVQCSMCHSEKDPHGGQFASPEARRKDCSSCHVMNDWKILGFDHDKISFNMSGAHRTVTCSTCHTQVIETSGRVVRVYRGTPVECLGCH